MRLAHKISTNLVFVLVTFLSPCASQINEVLALITYSTVTCKYWIIMDPERICKLTATSILSFRKLLL